MKISDDKDKLVDEDIHDQLIEMSPWGDAKNGEFIGRLAFEEWLSTSDDVPVYEFDVNDLIEDFILGEEQGEGGKFDAGGSEKARVMIESMKRMIARLEERMADV